MSKKNVANGAEEIAAPEIERQDRGGESPDGGQKQEQNPNPEQGSESGQKLSPEPEDDMNNRYLRLMADFQNYRRRTEKEKADIYAYANEKLISDLLDVLDDFERALIPVPDVPESYLEGMGMIFKNMKLLLEKAGLSEIESLGVDFDPNYHSAVLTVADSGYESGKICETIQRGYRLNNRVIRPSMVKVAE